MTARTFDELFEPKTWHLALERESEKHWVVLDTNNPDHPMLRTPDCDTAIRFMAAFCEKTPGASMQDHAETHYSWRIAQEADGVLSEPGQWEGGRQTTSPCGDSGTHASPPWPSPGSESANVLQFRRRPLEPVDEVRGA